MSDGLFGVDKLGQVHLVFAQIYEVERFKYLYVLNGDWYLATMSDLPVAGDRVTIKGEVFEELCLGSKGVKPSGSRGDIEIEVVNLGELVEGLHYNIRCEIAGTLVKRSRWRLKIAIWWDSAIRGKLSRVTRVKRAFKAFNLELKGCKMVKLDDTIPF